MNTRKTVAVRITHGNQSPFIYNVSSSLMKRLLYVHAVKNWGKTLPDMPNNQNDVIETFYGPHGIAKYETQPCASVNDTELNSTFNTIVRKAKPSVPAVKKI